MLPRRRLMLGLIISLVILLFYLSETAFWQEYLFSPQLVVWRKRVWLVYARNPLLGREARLRVRPLEGGREQVLDAQLGPVCIMKDYFVVEHEGLAFFRAEALLRGGEAVFGVALPPEWRVSALCGGEEAVYAGVVSEEGVGVIAVAPRPDAKPRILFAHKLKDAQVTIPLRHGRETKAVCLDGEGRVYLADRESLRETPIPPCRAAWAAWLKDTIHIFCVPADSLYEVAEYRQEGEKFSEVGRYEGRFSWVFGRRILLDVNGCVFEGKPMLVAMFGGVVAVGREKFREVLGPSAGARGVILLYMGLVGLTLAVMCVAAFRRGRFRTPQPMVAAGPLPRVAAYLIDSLIVAFVLALFLQVDGREEVTLSIVMALAAPLQLLYFIVSETVFGRTVGKSIMGLRVVDEGGERAELAQIIVRNVTRLVLVIEGPLLLLFGRRFGDWLSASRVAVWRREDAQEGGICDKGVVSGGRGEAEGDAAGVDGEGRG